MRYTERFVSIRDRLRLFVRDYAAEGRTTPVFCIHGLTRNSADFEDVAPFMAAQGHRVLAIDVRGRGRSDYDRVPSRYRADVYTDDVLQVLDALEVGPAVFVGTSMGGIITMLVAAKAPQRIAGAVLNDIGPVVDPAGVARIASYVGKTMSFASWDALADAIRASQALAFPDTGPAFWQAFARRVAEEQDGRIVFSYDPAIAQAFIATSGVPAPDMRPLFAALRDKPVLVVRGALSDILAPGGVEAMRQIKPDLDYVEVPRVGHAPTLDEPEVRQALSRFLERFP